MEGRLAMLAFIAAVGGVQTLAALPPVQWRLPWAASIVLLALLRWRMGGRGLRRCLRPLLLCACTADIGGLYAVERARLRLDDALPADQENQIVRVTLRVVTLAEFASDAVRFDAEILQALPAVGPRRIRVSWPMPLHGDGAAQRSVTPGQRWRAALLLKRPHGSMNPHAADAEARMFQRNVRATGIVRGTPRLLEDEGWRPGMVAVHRLRHVLRARMLARLDAAPGAGATGVALDGATGVPIDVDVAVATALDRLRMDSARYGPVIVALALGDQAGVPREDWQIFNATGITHLVSISGLHVTLVAGLAGSAVAWCWRRVRWRGVCLAERMPARLAGMAAALGVAWLYCLLAGWGIPARRTFFMLAVAGGAMLCRLPLSPSAVLLSAACAVVLLDPWAPVAPGFWLSFGAVAAVLAWAHATCLSPHAMEDDATGAGTPRWRRLARAAMQAGRLQCVVTLSLTPPLAFLTQQVSLASPLANALAIPVVSLIVTPLALLCAAGCAIPGGDGVAEWAGQGAQWVFAATMQWVAWLAARSWSVWDVAAPPSALLPVAAAGIGWALLAPAMASRRWAWLLILPALCWRPARPADGEWRLTALDVGQGGAVVIETARRTLVFDAGPTHRNGTDAAQRVIAPYLRARGIARIDTLVLSHGDQDHAGGLDSLLRTLPVDQAYASFDLRARLRRDTRVRGLAIEPAAPAVSQRCRAGETWETDGVRFAFLHPEAVPARDTRAHGAGRRRGKGDSNAGGCVLLVQGRHHVALLPGDVGAAQEQAFVDRLPPVDVLMAGHHGSATSSGPALVAAAQAHHVIAQVGYLNRFRHPAASVQRRWRRAGATFWRTDHHGAVIATSGAQGLSVRAQREHARRYWHAVP